MEKFPCRFTLFIFFLSFTALTLKEVATPYFPYLLTATSLIGITYAKRFGWKELLVGGGIIGAIVLSLNLVTVESQVENRVIWIKEYKENRKVAITENYKYVRLKDNRVEVGDFITDDGKLLLKDTSLRSILERERYRLYRKIEENIDYPISSVVGACTLGIRYELPSSLKGYFSLSGLYHFLAISGLHVGILIGALAGLLKVLKVPRPLTISSLLVGPLMPLTGFPPSAVRAYIFAFLVSLGIEEFRKIRPLYLLGVVFLITVLTGKFNLSAALSFSAVGGILLSVEGEGSKIEKSVKVAFAPLLFTLPIVLKVFGTVNFMSWLSTIILGFVFSPFLILSIISEVLQFKVDAVNKGVEVLGALFIKGSQTAFMETKWAVVHCEIPLFIAGGVMIASLILVLTGKVRYVLLPPFLLALFSTLNQTVITGKSLHLKGWKLNSFRFIATEGQRYRDCKIYGSYVMPATRKLLFRSKLIDERVLLFYHKGKNKGRNLE
ncbi:ComEC/Rec2 family competence protein [Thermovibrio sp.]